MSAAAQPDQVSIQSSKHSACRLASAGSTYLQDPRGPIPAILGEELTAHFAVRRIEFLPVAAEQLAGINASRVGSGAPSAHHYELLTWVVDRSGTLMGGYWQSSLTGSRSPSSLP